MVRQGAIHATDDPPPITEPTNGYLVCSLHGGLVGLDVTSIRHICTVGRVFRLPLLPDYFKGVTSIRGRLIPLVGLRLKLGRPDAAYHSRTCVVETEVSIPIAVAVDSVESVRYFAKREIVRATHFGRGIEFRAIMGIVPIESRFCLLLDLHWILLGRSSGARGPAAAGAVRPSIGRSQRHGASQNRVTVSSERADVPMSNDLNFEFRTYAAC